MIIYGSLEEFMADVPNRAPTDPILSTYLQVKAEKHGEEPEFWELIEALKRRNLK